MRYLGVRYLGTVVEETQLNTTMDLVLEFMSGSRDKQARYSLRNLSKKDYSGHPSRRSTTQASQELPRRADMEQLAAALTELTELTKFQQERGSKRSVEVKRKNEETTAGGIALNQSRLCTNSTHERSNEGA